MGWPPIGHGPIKKGMTASSRKGPALFLIEEIAHRSLLPFIKRLCPIQGE